ncbi:MAG: serine/threonine protein kinase, partial [Deltaproteobacteria bacterium]|nr:serine/threonine protein kinase [Deltaproteobacteria bacterium]
MSDQRANFKPHWFGEYELLKPLGVGGMAEVYLARTVRSKGFQKIVVVKRLLPQYAPDPHYVQMFIQEAKLTVQLQHANIVQIFSLEEHAGQPFIAMEYVHGKDLLRVLGRAREKNADLPIEFSVHCIAEMLKGLGYAHNASGPHGPLNLVHRDVTPSNIFISFEGDVKLGDFGVAHCVDSSQAKRVLGKLSYLAPEVIAGDRADARSDIYGAGVVLWETLALRPLFRANHEGELIMQILNRTPGPPSAHNARVPHDLDAIAARALAKQP